MAYWQQLEGEVDDELTKDVASLRAILSESVPPSYPGEPGYPDANGAIFPP